MRNEFECSECNEEAYFFLGDGTGFCINHTLEYIKEREERQHTPWECPYCKKKSSLDDKLFHLSIEHRDEIKPSNKKGECVK